MALLLRLARLGFQPLWWDEGWSLYFATTDLGAMLQLTAVDIHPPFYYLLLQLWIKLFGPSPISVRLLSALIGVGAVPLIYLAGRRLFSHRAGLLAGLLLAISPFHIYYSQEVRMYGLVTLLGAAVLVFGLFVVDSGHSGGRFWAWAGLAAAATAALYTQYYAAFLLLALNLAVLLWLRRGRPVKELLPWLAAQAAVVLLYLPWLWYAGDKLLTYVRYKVVADQDVPLDPVTYLARHLAAFVGGHAEGGLAGWWWLGLIPPLALALALLVFVRHKPRTRERPPGTSPQGGGWTLCLAIVVVILGCGYLVNLVFPFNPPRVERLLLLALPAFLLFFAAALLALWRIRPFFALLPGVSFLAVVILSLGFFYAVPRYPDDDYRPVAARLQALALPDDAVVCVHPWQVGYFESYLPAPRPELALTPREVIPRERQLWADDPALMAADLQRLLAGQGRLWLPAHQVMGRVLEEQIQAYLVENAYPTLAEWYGEHTLLSLFVAGEPQPAPVAAQFGDWLALDGAALGAAPLPAGSGVLAAELTWRLVSSPPAGAEDLTVGLRLVDAAGRVWAQRDGL
ncbi:MAG: glycosyltransferase family 39 protein, partial [Anaerolineae bacterium]|nr:glycosyltransferase family 39 protein [Anaerolineae bacterium]